MTLRGPSEMTAKGRYFASNYYFSFVIIVITARYAQKYFIITTLSGENICPILSLTVV